MKPHEDYQSPISLMSLKKIFINVCQNDAYEAMEYLKTLRKQRPYQSFNWHLAAGIQLLLQLEKDIPSFRHRVNYIIQNDLINKFDKKHEENY